MFMPEQILPAIGRGKLGIYQGTCWIISLHNFSN